MGMTEPLAVKMVGPTVEGVMWASLELSVGVRIELEALEPRMAKVLVGGGTTADGVIE